MPLYTWGANPLGQLGDGTTVSKSSPTQIQIFNSTLDSWSAISTGNTHTLAIRGSDLSLWAAGTNSSGQLGDGTTIGKSTFVKIGSSSWTAVSAGNLVSYGVTTDGFVMSWGQNTFGQLGDGTTVAKSSPVFVNSVAYNFAKYKYAEARAFSESSTNDIAARAVIRKSDGGLYIWGRNRFGSVGDGTTIDKSTFVKIGSNSWTIVSVAGNLSAGIDVTGALYTWGIGDDGGLGDNTNISKSSPVQIGTSSWAFVSVTGGGGTTYGMPHVAAIDSAGRLFMWGANAQGQLGDGTTINKSSPVQIGTSTWSKVSVCNRLAASSTPGRMTLAIDSQGRLFAWGSNNLGQLGDGTVTNKSSPVQIGTSSWLTCSTGGFWSTAIDINGRLFAWGNNTYSNIDASGSDRSSPVQIGSSSWTAISIGGYDSNDIVAAAIDIQGRLFSWGRNVNYVALGLSPTTTTVPVDNAIRIGSTTTSYKAVSISKFGGFAIDTNDLLWVWGKQGNSLGQDGVFIGMSPYVAGNIYAPTEGKILIQENPSFLANTKFINVEAGSRHATSVAANTNYLYTWGYNLFGSLGDGTTVNKSSPVPVYGVPTEVYNTITWNTSPNLIAAENSFYMLAANSTGSLFAVGSNYFGGFGGTATVAVNQAAGGGKAYSFIPITASPAGNPWVSFAVGNGQSAGIDSAGKLYTWGLGTSGQLGDLTLVSKSSPVQVLAGTSFTAVKAAATTTYAVRSSDYALMKTGTFAFPFGDPSNLTVSSPVVLASAVKNYYTASSFSGLHTLAIDSAGLLWSWGTNAQGQLGDGTTVNKSSPVQIGTSTWSTVFASQSHSMAIDINGNLYTWGGNSGGQLGDGTTVNKSSPVQIPSAPGTTWTKLTPHGGSIGNCSVAINSLGQLWVWGRNVSGEHADYTTISKSSPVQVPASLTLSNSWKVVSAGDAYAIGIRASDSSLWGWGNNNLGRLGDGTTVSKSVPIKISSAYSWTKVSAGAGHTLAINTLGQLWAWGQNATNGQLGDGTTVNKSSPVQIGASSWTTVSAGASYSMAVDITGRLFMWGQNGNGQLGDNTIVSKSSPVQIGSSSWSFVAGGHANSGGADAAAAITSDGKLFAWGLNSEGQLGDRSIIAKSSPVQVASTFSLTNSWTQIAAASSHVTAIRASDSTLWSWGGSSDGALGNGSTVSRSEPVRVGPPFFSASLIATKGQTVGAISTTGELYMWGFGTSGNIGNGAAVSVSSPVKIGTSSWSVVTANSQACGAIDITGRLFVWGGNSSGQLGDGTTINKSSPVQLGALTTWSDIDMTSSSAGRIGNTVYTWGNGTSGILGNNTALSRSSPVAITGNWQKVVIGGSLVMYGIDTGGKLWSWGAGTNGQLGDGTTTDKSNPVQIGTSNWSQIAGASGVGYTFAIDTAGRLFAWGTNGSFRLGDGTTIAKSSPVQTASSAKTAGTIGKAVSGGLAGGWYIASNGNVYGWGDNTAGQIGDGTTVAKSSPVLITSIEDPAARTYNSWNVVAPGGNNMLAIRNDGTLWAWGYGLFGSLGDGTTIAKSTMVQIGTSSWSAISSGTNQSLGLIGNQLYAWGTNAQGQLGDGTTINKSSPVAISGANDISAIDAWLSWSVIVNTSGRISTFGLGTSGQLGDGTTINKSSPVVITSVKEDTGIGYSSWSMISSGGFNNVMGILTDGSLYAWGDNTAGKLGDGTTVAKSAATKIGNSSWAAISAGVSHSLGVTLDGKLFSWGANASGQLGDNTTVGRSSPAQVPSAINSQSWFALTSISGMTAAINSGDRSLWVWGLGTSGQLGDGTIVSKSSPVQIGSSSWNFISTSASHTAAIDTNGRLYMWGANAVGQLGDGTTVAKSSPIQIGSSSWTFVSCGGNFSGFNTAAIDINGRLFTWGSQINLSLGDGTTISRSSPVQIGVGTSFTAVSVWGDISTSGTASFAIDNSGNLWGWGQHGGGNTFPNSNTNAIGTITQFSGPGTSSVAQFAGIGSDRAVRLSNNTVLGWGTNGTGALGQNNLTATSIPVIIGGGSSNGSWKALASGQNWFHLVDMNDRLYFTGINNFGQGGLGNTNNSSSPTAVSTLTQSVYLPYGRTDKTTTYSGFAQLADATNAFYIWGYNNNGQLGDGTTVSKTSATYGSAARPSLSGNTFESWGAVGYNSIAALQDFSVGVKYNATGRLRNLATWGINSGGQLGDGTTVAKSSPTLLTVLNNLNNGGTKAISGGLSGAAIFDDGGAGTYTGGLYLWGTNTSGQLGNGYTLARSSPAKVGANISWRTIDHRVGGVVLGGIDMDNPLSDGVTGYGWLWGTNSSGQLGDGSTIDKVWPMWIQGKIWRSLKFGINHTLGIDSNYKLWAWGNNTYGQLGDGTTISKSSPVQIGTSSWSVIALSQNFSHAITTDGKLFAWGLNNISNDPTALTSGTLGDGTTVSKSSPVQIGSSSWAAVSHGGSNRVIAITVDNLMYVWGYDFAENSAIGIGLPLGLGPNRRRPTIYTSPVQVATSYVNVNLAVNSVSPSNNFTVAVGTDNNLYTWGLNVYGQLGDYSTVNKSLPLIIGSLDTNSDVQGFNSYLSWSTVSSVNRHVAGITTAGGLYTWGENVQGQMGDNSIVSKSQPIKIGNSSWSVVSAGSQYTLGLLTTKALFAWGDNSLGQLGDNTVVLKSSPIQIGTSSWSVISAGIADQIITASTPVIGTNFAIDPFGKLYAWGQGTSGQLADNTLINKSSPVLIGTSYVGIGVSSVAAGVNHSVFLGKNNSGNTFIITTGQNNLGQLGDGTTINKSSPVLVGINTKGNTVYSGANTTFKI